MKLPNILKTGQFVAIVGLALWPLGLIAMDSGDYLRNAQNYFDKGEYGAAVIQLKNTLLVNPDNGPARLLLGQAYLNLGKGSSAQKELSLARELGIGRETVLEPLGRSLLMTGESGELLRSIFIETNDSVPLKVNILLLQGQAHLAKQNYQLAEDKFSRALELDPVNVEALLGRAKLASYEKDLDGGAALVDRVLSIEPDNVEAWVLKGELLRVTGQPQEAVTAFQKALDIAPGNVLAIVGKVSALIMLGESDKALEDIKWLQDKYPQMYVAHYLKALVFFNAQQLDRAQESVRLALKQSPDYLPGQLLAGTIAYQQGQLNLAERHLRIYFGRVPDNPQVTKLLAATLLKLKEPAVAVEVMEPGAASAANDAQYLALLGGAYLAMGDASKGMEYMERATALEPEMAALRLQLAIARLAEGEMDQAVGELQAAVELDPALFQADFMRVLIYLQKQDFDSALTAAEALVVKIPESPVPLNMKGAALLGKGDRQEAKEAFEAALRMQPNFLPAHFNLAQLDLMGGEAAAAAVRYKKVLSYDANNQKGLLGLAVLAQREGRSDEAERWLRAAREHHPDDIGPALLLVEHYLRKGDVTRALDLAKDLATAHPRNAVVLKALVAARLESGEYKEALTTLRSLVEMDPESPSTHYRIAMVRARLEGAEAARASLQRAIELQADFPRAQLALGRLYINEKDYDAAYKIVDDLNKLHPDAVHGYELEGDVHFSRKEYLQAAESYSMAYSKVAAPQLVQKRYQARLLAGNKESAYSVLRQWLDEHPEDAALRILLASAYQQDGRTRQAIEQYLQALAYAPDNVAVLNNLAWLFQEQGSQQGLIYAERAYELAPGQPEVMDTLGWLLLQKGDTNRGLLLLQEAAVKAPHMAEIRYHMAVGLAQAGRKDEARKELDRLLKSGKDFQSADDARKLRKQMGG